MNNINTINIININTNINTGNTVDNTIHGINGQEWREDIEILDSLLGVGGI